MSNVADDENRAMSSRARTALMVVTLTYVAVTVGESILAPVLPVASPELALDPAAGGRMLGVLSLSAAAGNVLGGAILARLGSRIAAMTGAAGSAAGSLAVAAAQSETAALAGHTLIGFGAGFFFAAGVFSVGALAPSGRRGRAMGRYGIAYSVALALAALLVATVGSTNWRAVFVIAAALSGLALVLLMFVSLPAARPVARGEVKASVRLLGAPVLVGGVAALAQFGLVAYIPTYAVADWSVTVAAAAAILFAGRVLSIPAKAVAGWMIDRGGAERSAKLMTLVLMASGAAWLLVPGVAVAALASMVFASAAGAMFPMANVVAVERFGDLGGLLGIFRSLQMAIAGISVWVIGQATVTFGLTRALLVGVLCLGIMLLMPTGARSAPSELTDARSPT